MIVRGIHLLFPAILISFCAGSVAIAGELDHLVLMPIPESVTVTNERFRLGEDFTIGIEGKTHNRLYIGAKWVLQRLAGRTGLFLEQDYLQPGKRDEGARMIVRVDHPGRVMLGEDESYTLTVDSTRIVLAAPTDLGALHGLETFLQLLSSDHRGYYIQGVKIDDRPRFQWRGLMIDASRHFMPVDVILRNIDGMAAMKLNVFHWHLSDDQGFRVESKTYPLLHEKGSDGLYYTQEQLTRVVRHADERGIRVVPEFDVPGHATSWLVSYPELASGTVPEKVERQWGIFYPVINPAHEFSYKLLDGLFGEMAGIFPDPYFHIGGDEIESDDHVAKDWNENPDIKALKEKNGIKDNQEMQAYFNERVREILVRHGKIMLGWDEILHERMPKDVVIQSWRGRASMEAAARNGYRSILSNGYYIDLIQPTEFHYLNDPIPADSPLGPEERKLILGGESTMWSEFVSPETIDSRIWPRQSAIAERLWSPQNVRDLDDMFRRMDATSLQLEELGLTHEKNYAMMLRRISHGREIGSLETFVDVLEPVKLYNRNQQRPHTSASPLTRVVDAARPDARVAREFRRSVDRYLAARTAADEELIRYWLSIWYANHTKLLPLIESSPVLWEVKPLSELLSRVADLGINALDILAKSSKQKLMSDGSAELLRLAREPRGQVELVIVSAVEKLVAAASEQGTSQQ